MEIWNKLKERLRVKSNSQVLVILIVFSLTGFSTLYVHNYIDLLLGIKSDSALWIKLVTFVILVLPVFSILLFIWGTLLGQREFVTEFLKYKINLIFRRKI